MQLQPRLLSSLSFCITAAASTPSLCSQSTAQLWVMDSSAFWTTDEPESLMISREIILGRKLFFLIQLEEIQHLQGGTLC